jgi:hypothetical protein
LIIISDGTSTLSRNAGFNQPADETRTPQEEEEEDAQRRRGRKSVNDISDRK